MKTVLGRGFSLLSEAAAVLIGADASERELLDELATTLGCENAPSLFKAGLPHVEEARRQLTAIVEGSAPSPDDALAAVIAELQHAIAALEAPTQGTANATPTPPHASASVARPSVDGVDIDILDEFVTECTDHLDSAEGALLALENQPGNADLVNTIFRAFHTIKSTSSLLGLTSISDLSHAAENILDQARCGALALSGAHADRVLAVGDVLKEAIGSLRGGRELAAGVADKLRAMTAALNTTDTTVAPEIRSGPPTAAIASSRVAAFDPAELAVKTAAMAPGSGEAGLTLDASVRVTTDRLNSLVNLVGELVVAQALITNDPTLHKPELAQLAQRAAHAHKILRRLQDLAMSLRMVPLRATFQKVERLVHDLSRKSGKRVQLVCEGEDTEIDRNMVEHLNDPLVHMVRNAIGHGIESTAERVAAGKSEIGTIALRAYHTAGSVVIELEDDGRGLDCEAIRATAIARGLLTSDAQTSESELLNLIWIPGFSTAAKVSEVVGRGVGMDVVKRAVEALRGRVDLRSEVGKGTHFCMRLPLTMAIIDAVLLKVGATRLLLPTVAIVESFRPSPGSISGLAGRASAVHLRDDVIRILHLADVIGVPDAVRDPYGALLVVIDSGGVRCALQVDHLMGQQQVVIKSLGTGFEHVRGVAGAAILGDGRVGLILDPAGLVGMADVDRSGQQQGAGDDNSGAASNAQHQAQSGEVSHLRAWS